MITDAAIITANIDNALRLLVFWKPEGFYELNGAFTPLFIYRNGIIVTGGEH